tara:strand:+ start:6123 stop:6431 length:309 start_codon:yes stop_codon:yes gene_type:complete
MRVKLSYSVEADDVLSEASKLISLAGDDMKQAIDLFTAVQNELRPEAPGVANTTKALEMIEEYRLALLNIDTRLAEVGAIVHSYEAHRHTNFEPAETEAPSE